VRLAGCELVSPLSFRGRKGGCGGQDPGLRVHLGDSAEGKSGAYGVSTQAVRNHAEDQGLGVIGTCWRRSGGRSIARLDRDEVLRQTRGGPGICATAAAKYGGRMLLAFSPHARGMNDAGMVGSLIERVLSLGFRIRTVALEGRELELLR